MVMSVVDAVITCIGLLCVAGVLHFSRLIYRDADASRRRGPGRGAGALSVHQVGNTIHLVPGNAHQHVIDRTGDCGCRPSTSLAQGATDRWLLFIDHHNRGGAALPSRTTPQSGPRPRFLPKPLEP